MTLQFFDHGAARLAEVIQQGTLCAFDFDGTLAPIVKEPERARMPTPVVRRLNHLRRYAQVAVVSGRSLSDLQKHLEFSPDFTLGSHGVEGSPNWETRADEYQRRCQVWRLLIEHALKDRSRFDPGIRIEDKTYTLSVHYRLARDRVSAETNLGSLFSAIIPTATVISGKCVFNILPEGAPNKGEALTQICQIHRIPAMIYVGDDVTDEEVFKRHRRDWLTIKVERDDTTGAEFYLNHRLDVVRLLDMLIAQFEAGRVAA
jgi:trehalose 6-phosphate phosphatase